MKRQIAIFIASSMLIAAASLAYNLQALADLLVLYPDGLNSPGTVIRLNPSQMHTVKITELVKAQQVVHQRLDQLALPGYYAVQVQDNHLQVTLPTGENTPYIVNIITRIGKVTFIDGGVSLPPLSDWKQPTAVAAYQTLFDRDDISAMVAPRTDNGEIFYQITLNPAAAKRFDNFNAQNSSYICLALDGQMTNCTQMYHWAGNTIDILPGIGNHSETSLADIAIFLNSGPLPMPLEAELIE